MRIVLSTLKLKAFAALILAAATGAPSLAFSYQKPESPRVVSRYVSSPTSFLSYSELMSLPLPYREKYLGQVRAMLLEIGDEPLIFDGNLIVENEMLRRFDSLAALVTGPHAEALFGFGEKPEQVRAVDGKECPTDSVPEEWATGVYVCKKAVAGDAFDGALVPVTGETECAKSADHVLVTSGKVLTTYSCIPKSHFEALEKKKLLATWRADLTDPSKARLNRTAIPAPHSVDGAIKESDAAHRTIGETAEQKATALKAAESSGTAMKKIQPVTDKDLNDSNQCVQRSKKTSKDWQKAREEYLSTPGSEKKCVYAGWPNDYKSGRSRGPAASTLDPKRSACSRPQDHADYGDLKITCAKGQILCNPLLFGIASVDGNKATGICVSGGKAATQQCDDRYREARGETKKSTREARAEKRRADAEVNRSLGESLSNSKTPPAPATTAAAPVIVAPATTAPAKQNATKNAKEATEAFYAQARGSLEDWNNTGNLIAGICETGSKSRKIHCKECQIMHGRLNEARTEAALHFSKNPSSRKSNGKNAVE